MTQRSIGFGAMFSSAGKMGIHPIILPFEAVLESVEQVRPMEDDE